MLKLAADEQLKLILDGAEEGWLVAGELAAAGVPVPDRHRGRPADQFETLGSRLDNAARLQAAGVTVAIEGAAQLQQRAPGPLQRRQRRGQRPALCRGAGGADHQPGPDLGLRRPRRLARARQGRRPGDLVAATRSRPRPIRWRCSSAASSSPHDARILKLRDRYAKPAEGYPRQYN